MPTPDAIAPTDRGYRYGLHGITELNRLRLQPGNKRVIIRAQLSVEDLRSMSDDDLLDTPGIGLRRLREIREALFRERLNRPQ